MKWRQEQRKERNAAPKHYSPQSRTNPWGNPKAETVPNIVTNATSSNTTACTGASKKGADSASCKVELEANINTVLESLETDAEPAEQIASTTTTASLCTGSQGSKPNKDPPPAAEVHSAANPPTDTEKKKALADQMRANVCLVEDRADVENVDMKLARLQR